MIRFVTSFTGWAIVCFVRHGRVLLHGVRPPLTPSLCAALRVQGVYKESQVAHAAVKKHKQYDQALAESEERCVAGEPCWAV